jgi:hypothetical protein
VDVVRIGIVGVNMGHAEDFARLTNGFEVDGGSVSGARVTAIWGDEVGDGERTPASPEQMSARIPGPSGSEALRLAAAYGIDRVVDYPRDMVGLVDLAVIIDDTGHGASHAAIARPFLEAGIATFVDKPMALSVVDAVAMFEIARASGAPLFSSSSLRYTDGLEDDRSAGDPTRCYYAVSDGPWFYYGVHLADMLSAIGAGRPQTVQRTAFAGRDVVVACYADGATALIDIVRGTALHGHRLDVRTATGTSTYHVDPEDYDVVFRRELVAAVTMARTGRVPVEPADTLDVIGLLELGERSAVQGGARLGWETL